MRKYENRKQFFCTLGMTHVSYLPSFGGAPHSMYYYPSGMQPPSYYDQSKFKQDEPVKFRIKDIEGLQRALKRAGISEEAMKSVILTKEENGETHVQISVPIAELFKAMADNNGNETNLDDGGGSASYSAPIFYNDGPKKELTTTTIEPELELKSVDNTSTVVTESTTTTTTATTTTLTTTTTQTSTTTPTTTTTIAITPSTTTATASTTTTIVTTPSTTTTTKETTISTTTTTTAATTTTSFVAKQVVVTKDSNGIKVSGEGDGIINLQKLTRPNDEDVLTPGLNLF